MSVVIQSASVDDAAAIAGVHISGLRAAYQAHIPEHLVHLVPDPPDEKQRARGWRAWLKRSQVSTFVARVDGTVAGFCTLHPMRDEATTGVMGEITAIHVLPSHWRRGIGRLLCEQTVAKARTRGFAEVVLWVLEPNERARRFYNSLGFRPDGRRRTFLERSDVPLLELRYQRKISQAAADTGGHVPIIRVGAGRSEAGVLNEGA